MQPVEQRKRKPVNYLEVSQAEAIRIIRTRPSATNEIGCKLFSGSRNTDGYGQYQQKLSDSRKRNYLLHIVALRAAGLELPGPGEHASHRCHNRNCFNVQHIVVESALANNGRKGCIGDIHCPCCNALAYACQHEPKCFSRPNN
jgi:hypothetical protein